MSRLLITGVGGPAGIALGGQLAGRAAAGADLEWIGVDIVAVDDPHFWHTAIAPRADDAGYPHQMAALLEHYRPDLVIPTVSDELPQIAVLAEALGRREPGHRGAIVISSPAATAIAADKLLTMWVLQRAGIPVPRFADPSQFDDTADAIAWGGGPVVVKPRISRGGRGVVLVSEQADLDWPATGPAQIVQTFAEGVEYNPQVYRSPLTGRTTVVVLVKTELKQGRVGNAVSTARVESSDVPDVVEAAVATAEALDLAGPADLDIRRDGAGKPLVLEVNSRFGANSASAPELLEAVLHDWLG